MSNWAGVDPLAVEDEEVSVTGDSVCRSSGAKLVDDSMVVLKGDEVTGDSG